MDLDKASAALLLRGNHSRVINCFVHETARGHGIVSPSGKFFFFRSFFRSLIWSPGSTGQVIYGNVVSRTGLISARTTEDPADGVRVGNAVALHGVKYVADNVFVGFNSLCDKCRGFAAHADPSSSAEFAVERASGVVLEGNIFERSQATVGGYGAPAEQNVVNENFFAASELQIGQAAPTQAEVTGNLIAWSYLDSRYVWADSDPAYGSPSKPTVIRGNTVWFAPVDGDLGRMDDLPVLDLGTAAYVSATDKEKAGARPLLGAAPLPASLVVDGNTYGGPSTFFRLNAGGVKSTAETIADWRALTMRAGKQVDGASSVAKAPESGAHVVVRKNVYSPYRVHVVVFNYGNATNATVPLDSFVGLAMPMKFAVFKSAEQWGGKPVAEGALPSTAVDVPLSVNELVVSFVIVANAGKDPNFPPKCLDPTSAECDACPRFDDGCLDGKCRAGECLTTSLVCNRGGFCEEKASQSTTSASTATLSTLALLAAWTARLF